MLSRQGLLRLTAPLRPVVFAQRFASGGKRMTAKSFSQKNTGDPKPMRSTSPTAVLSLGSVREALLTRIQGEKPKGFSMKDCTEGNLLEVRTLDGKILEKIGRAQLPKYLERDFQHVAYDGLILREPTVKVAQAIEKMSSTKDKRVVLVGERGVGKSATLLQATALALEKKAIVLFIGDALEWTGSKHAFQPTGEAGMYAQPSLTATFLQRILTLNKESLEGLKTQAEYTLASTDAAVATVTVAKGEEVRELLETGAGEAHLATSAFVAVMKELAAQSEKDVLIAVDQVNGLYRATEYRDIEGKPLDPMGLVSIRAVRELVDGTRGLARGLVLTAMTEGDARYGKEGPAQGGSKGAEVIEVRGYSQEEAMAVSEYYAKTGVMHESASERLRAGKFVATSGNPRRFFKASLGVF